MLPASQVLHEPFTILDTFGADMAALATDESLLFSGDVHDDLAAPITSLACYRFDKEPLNPEKLREIIGHLVWSPLVFADLKGLYPVSGFTKPDSLLKTYMFNISN
jgi:hypothetical protein